MKIKKLFQLIIGVIICITILLLAKLDSQAYGSRSLIEMKNNF